MPSHPQVIVDRGDKAEIRATMHRLQAQNDTLVDQNEEMLKRNRELEQQIASKKMRRDNKRGDVDAGHLTASGDYRLWRSRNTGHVSASSLLQILETKGSQTLPLRSERRGGAAHYIVGRELATSLREEVDSATAMDWLQSKNPEASSYWIVGFSFGSWPSGGPLGWPAA